MIAWGGTWINAKVLSTYLSPNELTFWRFLFSFVCLIFVFKPLKISFKISRYNLLLSIICGVILAIYNQVFFLGTKYGLASFGGVLVTSLIPIVTFILVSLIKRKSPSPNEIFGMLLGAIGAMIILKIWSFDMSDILKSGNLYFFLATIIWPILTIISAYQKNGSPIQFSFYMFLVTTIIELFFLKFHLTNIFLLDFTFWINMLLLSVYGTTFATTVYFISVSKLGSNATSSFFFVVPLSAIIFSVIFLKESVGVPLILGGILTILAVYVINGIHPKHPNAR